MQHMKINLGFNMIGGSSLADNTTYTNFLGYSFNLGAYMYNNGYSSHFDSDGTLRLTKNYIVQLSVVFYHNYSNIKNFHSQIQIVQTSTNTIPDTTNLIGISSNGFNGNYTTQQQFCNYNTDNIPLYNSYYGNAKIIIKTLYDFKTLIGPFLTEGARSDLPSYVSRHTRPDELFVLQHTKRGVQPQVTLSLVVYGVKPRLPFTSGTFARNHFPGTNTLCRRSGVFLAFAITYVIAFFL
jgi:hypothetical protein